ncbi:MAG: DUF885 domain-containing protein [Robiginitomaculum sp.]|nr:MAG: DUF885 domain-containing protein [Robiginitomaculum sp.]
MIKRHMLTFIAAVFLLGGPARAQEEKLNMLIGDVRAFDLRENPMLAGREGDVGAQSRWPDVRPLARNRRAAINARFASRLEGINTSSLAKGAKVNADLLDFVLHDRLARARFDEAAMPFTNDSGFHTEAGFLAQSTRASSVQEAEAWIARLNALPTYFEQNIDNLRAGIDEGITQPQLVVDAVVATLKTTLADENFVTGFEAPLTALPQGMADQEKAALQGRLKDTITGKVRPAYENLLQFFEEEYRPEARTSIGITDVPGGAAYYADLVHIFTTTGMNPQQVHDLGKSEVARIRKEMEQVILQSGFEGSFADFLNFLRTDEQFYVKTPDDLLRHAAWIAKKADDQMPKMFGKLPRLPYGVRPVPAAIAPHYTTARYWPGDMRTHRAGGYMVNTYALDQRPLYELPALTLHEAVPGHHHQFALAQELENVPEFRKDLYLTAFGEGWGLYAEKLGIEMGMYTTPYENFGRLTYEMWRACRLVMDTGIHAFGWTREQAMRCLKDNSALALHNIETETDRYISWPGQALGYKIGELTIVRLRKKAETALGEKFDLRAFHDEVLSDGSITMAMLEAKIDRWIIAQKED